VGVATADRGAMRRPARGRHTCQVKEEVKDKVKDKAKDEVKDEGWEAVAAKVAEGSVVVDEVRVSAPAAPVSAPSAASE